MSTTDIAGYIAMTLLVVSFLPKKIKYIRQINFLACVFFVAYGFMLGYKWPIIVSNGLIACIQLYHLFINKEEAAKA